MQASKDKLKEDFGRRIDDYMAYMKKWYEADCQIGEPQIEGAEQVQAVLASTVPEQTRKAADFYKDMDQTWGWCATKCKIENNNCYYVQFQWEGSDYLYWELYLENGEAVAGFLANHCDHNCRIFNDIAALREITMNESGMS